NEFFPLERTVEGKKTAWTFLDQDEHNNDDIWENLPKLRWYFPVKKALSSATVIATHPTDKCEDKDSQGASKKMPLVVYGPYGSGKTLYIGTDELWRWRFGVGDRYHYRFYNQAIRYVAKKLGGQKRFRLDADKASYAIG